MERTLILYETKYGFTKKVAKSLFLILGPAKYCRASELNPNVSVAIYDSYKNMNELAGMQIMGSTEIIDIGRDEYISVLTQINLKKGISEFSSKTIEMLDYYVYIYSDPDSHKPFYVGKGKGNRAFAPQFTKKVLTPT